jgi:hypothetical protein
MRAILTGLSLFATSIVWLAACGNSTNGAPTAPMSTSVSGSVQGHAVVAGQTLGIYGLHDSVSGVPYAGVFIANTSGAVAWCPLLEAGGTAPPSSSALWIEVFNNANANPVPPGTYSMGASSDLNFFTSNEFVASDSACNETVSEQATGTMTLETVSPSTIAGTFDLMFPNGDHVTGQFSGPVCNFNLNDLGTDGGACGGDTGDP